MHLRLPGSKDITSSRATAEARLLGSSRGQLARPSSRWYPAPQPLSSFMSSGYSKRSHLESKYQIPLSPFLSSANAGLQVTKPVSKAGLVSELAEQRTRKTLLVPTVAHSFEPRAQGYEMARILFNRRVC